MSQQKLAERRKAMPKFLVLWKVDPNKAPVNPKDRGAAWAGLLNVIKQDIRDGRLADFGTFPGEARGYMVATMSELDLGKSLQGFCPQLTYDNRVVLSVDETVEVVKSLSG